MSNGSHLEHLEQLEPVESLEQLRGALTRRIAETGVAPTIDELAVLIGATDALMPAREGAWVS